MDSKLVTRCAAYSDANINYIPFIQHLDSHTFFPHWRQPLYIFSGNSIG